MTGLVNLDVFRAQLRTETPAERPQAVSHSQRTHNPLRPRRLNDMIGQERARAFLRRVIDAAQARDESLDHMLLVAPAGIGKSTIAHAIADELDVDCFQVEAPVSHEQLLELRETCRDGDVILIDEIHQQAIMERRGRSSSTQPEVLLGVLEDRTLVSGTGVLDFPDVTFIGATTDEGMLPDPFIARFPLRPVLEPYTVDDLARIAAMNARQLGHGLELEAALLFAGASRGVPRQVNNYVRNAQSLTMPGQDITLDVAREVVHQFNRTTVDGLTLDMQNVLTFLLERCQRKTGDGDVVYQASVNTIATAIGKSRDSKAIALRVEPYLISQGYLQVGHGGRKLTDAGVARAREILKDR